MALENLLGLESGALVALTAANDLTVGNMEEMLATLSALATATCGQLSFQIGANVLQQASVSMLSQANQAPNNLLQLLH